MANLSFLRQQGNAGLGQKKTIVDLHPWQTAQALTPLAVSAEETEFAHDAERLADHEVDQAFASALRMSTLQSQHLTLAGEALALSQKVAQLQQLIKADQAQVDKLKATLSSPTAPAKNSAAPDVDNDDLEFEPWHLTGPRARSPLDRGAVGQTPRRSRSGTPQSLPSSLVDNRWRGWGSAVRRDR